MKTIEVNIFDHSLYLEHLEESSFLYDQRGMLFHDPEIGWRDLEDFEERLEAHIDALVVGQESAAFVCMERAVEGDAGELHTAVRVFCRHKRFDLIQQVLDALDIKDDERVMAVRNALKQEWPQDWNNELERLLKVTPDKAVAVMPAVAGYKRLPAIGALSFVLPICPDCVLFPQIKSMGRLQIHSEQAAFFKHLGHKDTGISGAAALGLMRMGVSLAHQLPKNFDFLEFWQLMYIALAGGPEFVAPLLEKLNRPTGSADDVLALAVLGESKAIDALINYLGRQEEAETVAIGLNLITGADLYEEFFVPEEVDPDELFDDEIERLNRGEPLHARGKEPGITLVQLSRDPQKWETWWRGNRSNFKPGVRYRNGKPFRPESLLENLRSEKSPVLVRQIAYEELAVRYGVDIAFETDMTVKSQLEALKQMESIVAAKAGEFEAGAWYFAGRLIQ